MSLASVKSRLVLPFWYRLTRVVLEKGQLNGCLMLQLIDRNRKSVVRITVSISLDPWKTGKNGGIRDESEQNREINSILSVLIYFIAVLEICWLAWFSNWSIFLFVKLMDLNRHPFSRHCVEIG